MKNELENQPVYSNTFRLGYTETEFVLDFGLSTPETDEVKVVSRINIPPEKMINLLAAIFNSARCFEKKFQKDIGFGGLNQDEDY